MKHRRFFLMLLSLCLCVGLFSVSAAAVSGDCGELSWSLEEGTLTISGSGRMNDYDYYTTVAPWYDHVEDIKAIVIESGVTYIGDFAFVDCVNAAGVTIPDTVTAIGSHSFAYCSALKDVTIPGSVTTIGDNAFDSCYAMTAIKVPASVESLGDGVFSSCVSLEKITVNSGNANYRSVSGILYNKGKTKLICVPGGYTGKFTVPSTVTVIADEAFAGCMKLTGVTIPNSVTRIGYGAFHLCESLTSITIPNSVKNLGDMVFAGCYALESVTLSSNLAKIPAYAFFYCEKLAEVIIPGSVTSVGECAFLYCTDLGKVVVPASVKQIGYGAFANCTSLHTVSFLGDAPTFGDDVMHNAAPTCYYPSDNTTWTKAVRNKLSQAKWATITEAPVVTVSNVAKSGKVRLTWEAVENAFSYNIYRSTAKNGTYKLMFSTTKTSYINTSAKVGGTYFYKVEAVADDGYTGITGAAVKGQCVLARPVVSITNDDAGKPVLSWPAVEGAVKYRIYRCVNENGNYGLMKTVTGTTYTNLNAVAGKLYYYKVVAVAEKAALNSAESVIVSKTCDIPRAVVSVELTKNGKPMLTWEPIDGAVKYQIYRSTTKNGTYKLMFTTTKTSYTNTSAKAGKIYYYKVEAVADNTSANSTSAVISALCKLKTAEVTAKLTKNGKPMLSWESVNGAVKYQIYRSTTKNGSYKLMFTTTNTSYTNTSAKAGNVYYYKVVAVADNTNANSTSAVISAQCRLDAVEVTVKLNKNGKPVLSWESVEGAVKYQVWRCVKKNGTYGLMKTVTGTTYTNLNAVEGKTYYYKVIAIAADETANSKYSDIVSIKT